MPYALLLNDMRYRHVEDMDIVRVRRTASEIIQWYLEQLEDALWKDGPWIKAFRKGSDLEWYNPINGNLVVTSRTTDGSFEGIWLVPEGTVPLKKAITKM